MLESFGDVGFPTPEKVWRLAREKKEKNTRKK